MTAHTVPAALRPPVDPAPVAALIRAGIVDPELAALLWLLVEGRVPLLVAAGEGTQPGPLIGAFLSLLPHEAQAEWLLPSELDARAIGALAESRPVAGTLPGASLEDVFAVLEAAPLSLSTDELRSVGAVLVLASVGPGSQRVVAAHYVRPLERDAGGHVQRRPPAVLATWDQVEGCFEHFGWGIAPELAARVGRPAQEFDRLHHERTRELARLAARARVH